MAGRFYYAPVDPGYNEFGRGIARGIYGATDALERGAERNRRQPMEDLLEARTRMEAAQQGVREGPRPTVDVPVMPDFDMDPRLAGDATLGGEAPQFGMQPDARGGMGMPAAAPAPRFDTSWLKQPPELEMEARQNRHYMDLGETGFYGETPEFQQQQAMELAEREREQGFADLDRELGIRGDHAPAAPGRRTPVRGGDDMHSFDPETGETAPLGIGVPPSGGAGGAGGITPTSLYTQQARRAHNLLDAIGRLEEEAEQQPNETPEEFAAWKERQRAVLEELAGMSTDDARRGIRSGQWPSLDEGETPPRLLGTEENPAELDAVDVGAPTGEQRDRATQIKQAQEALREFPAEDHEQMLRDAGFDDDEMIEEILGGVDTTNAERSGVLDEALGGGRR